MRLVRGAWGVDFEAPVQMSNPQKEKFIEFMRKLVPGVEVSEVEEKEKKGAGGGESRHWTPKELQKVLMAERNEMLEKELGRSEMSIRLKKGELLPNFFSWARKKGHVVRKDNRKQLVQQFLAEEGLAT